MARSNKFDDYGDVLTLADVSALLGCHLETARLWARRGELPARKVGRSYLVLKRELVAWLETQPAKGAKAKRP